MRHDGKMIRVVAMAGITAGITGDFGWDTFYGPMGVSELGTYNWYFGPELKGWWLEVIGLSIDNHRLEFWRFFFYIYNMV